MQTIRIQKKTNKNRCVFLKGGLGRDTVAEADADGEGGGVDGGPVGSGGFVRLGRAVGGPPNRGFFVDG